ncbi:flavocytochrome c [Liquorilactobacillus capillatus]|uniref:Fumarate reductase flavoprotein subunit n=1 Tax=Liquorilactobacillus capillatus DSM 19910 TaxID=1423731 RepID=A0A0R1LY61_9LACO|nr:flavocytochrome c [Liquorilactobacillus capillatus]KRL00572.1 fumarate reductase flavoprotein subunit [Liquorilactobacillus capillatus DSM 19910]
MTTKFVFAPTPIEKMQSHYDTIIIGSGSTGLVSAIQAHELGLKPVILEKMTALGGNTNRASSGMNAAETNVQLHHGIIDSFDDFYRETYRGGGKLNDQDLLAYFTSHAALAVDWLADHSIKLDDLTITGGMSKMRTHRPATMAPIGSFLVKNLLKIVQQENIPLFTETTVTSLKKDDTGKISGVELQLPDGSKMSLASQAVVLATGGFGASKDIIQKYRPDLAGYKTTNQPGATGDGLKLAEEAGAELVQMNLIQVHPTVQQDNPHTYLIGEAVRGEGAILVNAQGKRFVNELGTRKVVSNSIVALPEKGAYLIFDQSVRNRVKAIEFYDHIGLVVTGENITELAAKVNMEPAVLAQTVDEWNTAVASKQDKQFGRATGMDRQLVEKPFFAIHIAPAVHYTMGGIHIDTQTRVIDGNGDIIQGLFAAGEVAGGLHGNNRIGGNSISETVVFGRQSGEQAAEYVLTNGVN